LENNKQLFKKGIMNKTSKIYLAGHEGMVGSTLLNELHTRGYDNIIYEKFTNLDLRNQNLVMQYFKENKPEYVFLIAGKVGGIQANINFPGTFLYDNMMIAANVINAAKIYKTKKLLFLGSSCIYPRLSEQPMKEEYLLSGYLEPTNEPYAIAKIAGIKMCQAYNRQYGANFISVMPTNLYGPNDNFDIQNAHVLPALIRKFHEAKVAGQKEVVVWGTGSPRREFLYVDDLADACIFLMNNYNNSPEIINIGVGKDISIRELALMVKEIVDYNGEIVFDTSKPDGTPRKLLDVSKLSSLGWQAKTGLREGIKRTYQWYVEMLKQI